MRRKAAIVVLGFVLGLVLGACGFQKEQFLGDAALPPVTVGFAQTEQLQDEASGAIQVVVRLSRPAPEPISVNYAFVGGSALINEDYAGMDGTLSFATGQTELGIDVTIALDTIEEEDETIEIALSAPSGAELGEAHHQITISKKLLPRVNFAVDASDALEDTGITLEITLDSAPLVESSVTIAYKQTSTAAIGFDFAMPANTTVTFPVNTLTQTVTVPVMNDMNDEDDETVVIELATSSNVVIGPKKERSHIIHDNDMAPSASISLAASTAEGNTGTLTNVTVTVTLSGPSGKLVTVPVTFTGGTATENTDYTYLSKADLVFTPNQNPALSDTVKTVTITIVGDTIDEDNQTIITSLTAAPTNATIGSPASQTQTITDDDAAPSVVFTTMNQTVAEGDDPPNTTTSYTLTLSAASEKSIGFDIDLTGTAVIPFDYTTIPAPNAGTARITIVPPAIGMVGATTATLDLVVVADKVAEGPDETIIMTIPSSNLMNVTRGAAANLTRTHTIDDGD